jgi:hypothetical protein
MAFAQVVERLGCVSTNIREKCVHIAKDLCGNYVDVVGITMAVVDSFPLL